MDRPLIVESENGKDSPGILGTDWKRQRKKQTVSTLRLVTSTSTVQAVTKKCASLVCQEYKESKSEERN